MKKDELAVGFAFFGFGVSLLSAGLSGYLFNQSFLRSIPLVQIPPFYIAFLIAGLVLLLLGANFIAEGFAGETRITTDQKQGSDSDTFSK